MLIVASLKDTGINWLWQVNKIGLYCKTVPRSAFYPWRNLVRLKIQPLMSQNSKVAENYSMQKIANVAESLASRHSADFGCMLA